MLAVPRRRRVLRLACASLRSAQTRAGLNPRSSNTVLGVTEGLFHEDRVARTHRSKSQ